MRRVLVVANQTLASEGLARAVGTLTAEQPTTFHIVVPATPPREHLVWTEGEARAVAAARLDAALAWFGSQGVEATGEVADPNPVLAVQDALIERDAERILIVTLPPGASRWIRRDVVNRIRSAVDLPVHHLVAEPAPTRSTA